jgi:hypothetical protein
MEIGKGLSTYLNDFSENHTFDFTAKSVAEVCEIIPFPRPVQSLTRDQFDCACHLEGQQSQAGMQSILIE